MCYWIWLFLSSLFSVFWLWTTFFAGPLICCLSFASDSHVNIDEKLVIILSQDWNPGGVFFSSSLNWRVTDPWPSTSVYSDWEKASTTRIVLVGQLSRACTSVLRPAPSYCYVEGQLVPLFLPPDPWPQTNYFTFAICWLGSWSAILFSLPLSFIVSSASSFSIPLPQNKASNCVWPASQSSVPACLNELMQQDCWGPSP